MLADVWWHKWAERQTSKTEREGGSPVSSHRQFEALQSQGALSIESSGVIKNFSIDNILNRLKRAGTLYHHEGCQDYAKKQGEEKEGRPGTTRDVDNKQQGERTTVAVSKR